MNRTSFSGHSYTLAEVGLDAAQVSGRGGANYPRLGVLVELTLRATSGDSAADWLFSDLRAELRINSEAISHSLPVTFREMRWRKRPEATGISILLEFPLDSIRVAALERFRNGGNIAFNLQFTMFATEFPAPPGAVEKDPRALQFSMGPRGVHRLHADLGLNIAQSVWINQVLPGVGFGKVHILELPAVPVAACESLASAFGALIQAQDLHKQGLYDEAVGRCRVALESILERTKVVGQDGKEKEIPQLPNSWEKKLGKRTYDWLASTLPPLKDATNKVLHPPYVEHYDQLESQMILAIVTALMSYAARHQPT